MGIEDIIRKFTLNDEKKFHKLRTEDLPKFREQYDIDHPGKFKYGKFARAYEENLISRGYSKEPLVVEKKFYNKLNEVSPEEAKRKKLYQNTLTKKESKQKKWDKKYK